MIYPWKKQNKNRWQRETETKKNKTDMCLHLKNNCDIIIHQYITNILGNDIISDIKDIILKYYYIPIISNILNENEFKLLFNMVYKHRNIQSEWELIYQASRDGHEFNDFHSNVKEYKPTISIIETTNGDVFGGFISIPWYKNNSINYRSYKDNNAFLFTIRASNPNFMDRNTPKIFPIKPELSQHAIGSQLDFYLMFGKDGNGFYVCESNFDFEDFTPNGCDTYAGIPNNKNYLTCGEAYIQIKDIQTFILKDVL